MDIEVTDSDRQQAINFKEQGNQHFKSKNYSKAIEFYQKAISKNPTEGTFYQNRSICFLNMERYTQCIQDARKAIDLDPKLFKPYRFLAQSYLIQGKITEAKECAIKAKELSNNDQTVNNILDTCRMTETAYQKLQQLIQSDDLKEAVKKIEFIMDKCKKCEELKVQYIELLLKTGDTAKARIQINENYLDEPYLKALIEQYEQNNDKAKQIIKQNSTGHDGQKLLQLRKRIQLSDELKNKGNEALKAAKYPDAIKAYEEALAVDRYNLKFNSILYSNLGLVYMKQKKFSQALQEMNKSIQCNENYFKAYLRRGEIYMEQEDYDKAISDYNKVKDIDSKQDTTSFIQKALEKQKKKEKKDYYQILGVSKEATPDEIKRSYKKLALKWHPDRQKASGGDPDKAQKMFRDINEAYNTLSDPQKKKRYDLGGDDMFGGGGFPGGGSFNPQDIFSQFFSQAGNSDDSDFQGFPGGFGSMFGGQRGGGGGGGRQGGNPFGMFGGGGAGPEMFFSQGGQGGMGGMGGIDLSQLFGGGMGGMGGMGGQRQRRR